MAWFSRSREKADATKQIDKIMEETSTFQASKSTLKAALDTLGLSYDEVDGAAGNVIAFPLTTEIIGTVMVLIRLDEDGESMQFKAQLQGAVPGDRMPRIYEALSDCNAEFRWAKFYALDDGDEGRIMVDCDTSWEGAVSEILVIGPFLRMIEIAKRAYPTIMKAIWG